MAALPDLIGLPVEARDRERFLGAYGHLFEHSPWVVERAWEKRPYPDAAALHAGFMAVLGEASAEERLGLLRAHPKLADKAAMAEGLTADSAREQASAGLDRLSREEHARFNALNAAYERRFGFPFIVCVRLHDRAGILTQMAVRGQGDPQAELATALAQVGLIVRLRLVDVEVAHGV